MTTAHQPTTYEPKKTTTMKTTLSIISVLALATSLTCAEEAPKGPKKPGKNPPDLEAIFKSSMPIAVAP